MNRLIIAGSPRSNGRSAHLAEILFEENIQEFPEDELALAPVSELNIAPCTGCDYCRNAEDHECVQDDDMEQIRELLDDADEVVVVAPAYFGGAPAQLKALLDRLQPYFWSWREAREAGHPRTAKLPATLHIVGEMSSPAELAPLIGEVRAALAVAGFKLEHVLDWIGKIDESGEISAEPDEIDLATVLPQHVSANVITPDWGVEQGAELFRASAGAGDAALRDERERDADAYDGEDADAHAAADADASHGGSQGGGATQRAARPKLDLSGSRAPSGKRGGSGRGSGSGAAFGKNAGGKGSSSRSGGGRSAAGASHGNRGGSAHGSGAGGHAGKGSGSGKNAGRHGNAGSGKGAGQHAGAGTHGGKGSGKRGSAGSGKASIARSHGEGKRRG